MSPCLCGDPHCGRCFSGHRCLPCPVCSEPCIDDCSCDWSPAWIKETSLKVEEHMIDQEVNAEPDCPPDPRKT